MGWLIFRECARVKRQFCWRVTPKVHKLQHIPLYSEVLNPRHVQNYSEESLIGTTARIWKGSMDGQYQKSAQSNVLLKRTVGLLLRFE